MRARLATSVVLAASLLVGMSGCAFFSQQATLIHYDPSDGVGTSVGNVKVRNALLLTADNGKTASFVSNFINDGTSTADVHVQYNSTDIDFTLRPGQVKSFGGDGDKQLVFEKIGKKPGQLLPVFVQYGSHTGSQMLVPILDGTWSTYTGLLPTATPTPTPTPTQTLIPGATLSPTPTPTH